MKYIKTFNAHTDYEIFVESENLLKPNVSYCKEEEEIHYKPIYDSKRFVAEYDITNTTSTTQLFNNPSLIKKLEIDGVKYTGNDIFQHYWHKFDTPGIHIVKYTLQDNVTTIDGSSFASEASPMISITIPDTITSIGSGAFSGRSSLEYVRIPNSVTSIGGGAFSGCTKLTSIEFPSSLTSISGGVFNSLLSIHIPSTLTSIDPGAFQGCGNLTSITVDPNNPVYDSRDNCNAIIETATNTLIRGCKNTIIPDGITSILAAFNNCRDITSVGPSGSGAQIEIPDSVTVLSATFADCNNLASVTLPETITTIANVTFSGCTNLTSIILPNNVTSIGLSAFHSSGLTSIIIPDSVTTVGSQAFSECPLTSVIIRGSNTVLQENVFLNCTSLESVTALATTALTISNSTFRNVKENGTLYVPVGSSGYDVWMGTGNYYLGKYNWTKVEQ